MVLGILVFKGVAKGLIVMLCCTFLFDFGNNHENWKLQNAKTRVGFGRTKVSVRLDCIVFSALSWHGPRNPGVHGFGKTADFHASLYAFY